MIMSCNSVWSPTRVQQYFSKFVEPCVRSLQVISCASSGSGAMSGTYQYTQLGSLTHKMAAPQAVHLLWAFLPVLSATGQKNI